MGLPAANDSRMRLMGLRNDDYAVDGLLERLPVVRGSLVPNAPLAERTWFRVGGTAEVLFQPKDSDDLAWFLAQCPADVPITVLGLASNVLIRDGGILGVVIRLTTGFSAIKTEGASLVVGASALDLNVARAAQSNGLAGLEFLSGIPGSIGGGLRMNAGAFGREVKDIVTSVRALDREGNALTFKNAQMGFSYRHCAVAHDVIFIQAELEGETGDPAEIRARMASIQAHRVANQPIRERTGGSTFANPTDDPRGRKAWQLIDAAGCRGLRVGGAKVSEKHCNFLINTGRATAADIEALGEEVRRRVHEQTGVMLRWEIKRLGVA